MNAGPRHRFTAAGRLVHNCLALGYGGGVGALRTMGATGTDAELTSIRDSWRAANRRIVGLWGRLEDAFRTGGQVGARLSVAAGSAPAGEVRRVVLPSGRELVYWAVDRRSERLSFLSHEGVRVETYGGRLTENIVQAVARDLLADALVELTAAGCPVVGHVHDEVIVEGDEPGVGAQVAAAMRGASAWAEGLPLDAAPFTCDRYRK